MCVSAAPANFRGAVAFGGEVSDRRHLLGYQNRAQSLAGPNCMLLHVPTNRLDASSLLPTNHAPHFMTDMGQSVQPLMPSLSRRFGATVVPYGAYEVVLASSAQDIPAALAQVSAAKRPIVSGELLAWYDQNYPSYSFILACFNNREQLANHPILVQYCPLDPERLFVPGLESRTGKPPVLGSRDQPRDFTVVFGSRRGILAGTQVKYQGNLGNLAELLPTSVVGFRDQGSGANADYQAPVAAVRGGVTQWGLFELMPEHSVL